MNHVDANASAAAAAAAPSSGGSGGGIPNFLDDPGSCLNTIANRPASRELWGMLGGTVASCIKEEQNPHICFLYLQAVAQQLPASDQGIILNGGVASAAAAAVGVASANNRNNSNSNMEAEMVRAQRLMEILDAVGLAAAKCHPRQAISQSGILRALLAHPIHKASELNQIQVEFCQAAVLAEQYRFAARVLQGAWPRPTSTISVRHVLRYFLLRGIIHVGCNDWNMAVRCFWTCLSIPSEIVSAVAVAAWKKLVLVQCLQMEDDDYRPLQSLPQDKQSSGNGGGGGGGGMAGLSLSMVMSSFPAAGTSGAGIVSGGLGRGPLSLPKAVPACFSRFLNMASSKQQNQQQQQQQQQRSQPEEFHSPGIMVQEDLTEPSSQQQQQRQSMQQQEGEGQGRPQQQHQHQPYAAMGVRVYMDLVQAFLSGDRSQFQTLLHQNANLLQDDGNLGLVRQCETAMLHRQVYQLSRMFAVIPLTDLATKLRLESVDKTKDFLLQLSMKKACGDAATSKHSKWPNIEVEDDGMVVFNFSSTTSVHEEVGNMTTAVDMERELGDNIKELIHLTKQVEKLDVSIATAPMYHALVRRANDAKMGGPRGVEEL